MPLNFFCVTSFLIFAPQTLSIYRYAVNNSAQGEEVDFEISCLILQKSQIRVCTPLPYNKYRLYIGVVYYWYRSPLGQFCP